MPLLKKSLLGCVPRSSGFGGPENELVHSRSDGSVNEFVANAVPAQDARGSGGDVAGNRCLLDRLESS
jgi:hypothetical protein